MNFAMCYSANWKQYVEIEAFAILKHNPGSKVHLLSDTLGKIEMDGCIFIDVQELYLKRIPSQVNVDGRFTRFALYRLLIPEVVPESRVLYVDADALVTAPLKDFYASGLSRQWPRHATTRAGNAIVAGVKDIGILESQINAIGLTRSDHYINAGVTLMDLSAIVREGLHWKWIELVNKKHFSCHDQCIINMTCKGRINYVGNEYNSSLSTGFHEVPRIMHWAGGHLDKPWNNPQVRRFDLWERARDDYAKHQADRAVARGQAMETPSL